MASSAMMAAAETLASVASAGPSGSAQSSTSDSAEPERSDDRSPSEPKKRTRPVSACEACRAKKVKCLLSPDAPVCQNCLTSGKQCLFRVDDLAPALRAARFAHCGPPSANARTIASNKKGGKAGARTASEDASDPSRPKQKRKKSQDTSHDRSDDGEVSPAAAGSNEKKKAKAVFRSFANPSNLAAPLPSPVAPPTKSSSLDQPHNYGESRPIAPRHRSGTGSISYDPHTKTYPPLPSLKHRSRFGHHSYADMLASTPDSSFTEPHDPSYYGHPVSSSGHAESNSAGGPSVFLQHNSPTDGGGRSPRPGRASALYSGGKTSMQPPPPHSDQRWRSSQSQLDPRSPKGRPIDPMSLEYYGHPADPNFVRFDSNYVRFESIGAYPEAKSMELGRSSPGPRVSDELRDGIERWQRDGPGRPVDEPENADAMLEEVSQPRPKIVLPFFRWFGTTANTPGYRKIKVGVLQDSEVPGTDDLAPALEGEQDPENRKKPSFTIREDDDLQTPSSRPGEDLDVSPQPLFPFSPGPKFIDNKASSSVTRELFEINRPRYPRKDLLEHLVSLFLTHFKPSWCPWIEDDDLKNGVENGSMPAILANAVCAVAARFSNRPELRKGPRKSSGDPFSEMAKILIIPLLSFPSVEVIEALILLSYAEFAAGSDSGLWMYVGMALRMAQDLGLQHEVSVQSIPNEKHQEKARLLFWAVIGLDRITTFGTGRPVSIRESEIDTELPRLTEGSDMSDATVVFGHVVRILMLRGRMGEVLNLREKEDNATSSQQRKRDLTRMWYELAQSYSNLPADLHFNVQTFQKSAANNQSPGFVYLHVLFQSTIGLLDRPALMKKFTGDSAPLLPSFAPAASAAASRTIADILTLGDAFDDRCITASPYLDQLVLPAGRSFLAEREAAREALRSLGHGTTPAPSRPPSRDGVPPQPGRSSALVSTKSYAEINLGACQRILQKLQQYWAGASWPLRALEQEAAGNKDDVDPQASDEDAQSAPIRDIEMVLKWAKSRIRSQKRLARSLHATPRADAMSLSESAEGISGAHMIGSAGAASDEFTSTHSEDSPFGLGISAGLTFDIDALMGSWQVDQFDPLSSFHAPVSLSHFESAGDSNQHQQSAQHQHGSGPSPFGLTPNAAGAASYPTPGSVSAYHRRPSLSLTPSHQHQAHHQPQTPSSSAHLQPHGVHLSGTIVHSPSQHHPSHSRNSSLHHGGGNNGNNGNGGPVYSATPGQLDTSSFAVAEFFSHDQSVWPLSIQNEEIDQEAVNLIASALQLPPYQ